MRKDKINDSIVHLNIYRILREHLRVEEEITYKEFINIFKGLLYYIPKKHFDIILKELIDYCLIEKVCGGRYPKYKILEKDYNALIVDLDKIEQSTQRFKILKSKHNALLKKIEEEERSEQKYHLLKCDYESLLRKLELKKLEENHYW